MRVFVSLHPAFSEHLMEHLSINGGQMTVIAKHSQETNASHLKSTKKIHTREVNTRKTPHLFFPYFGTDQRKPSFTAACLTSLRD